MKAFILKTDTIIEPFLDPAREMPVLNRPLGQYVAETLEKYFDEVRFIDTLDEAPAERALVIADDCFLTPHFARRIAKRLEQGGHGQICLEEGDYTKDKEGLDTFDWRAVDSGRVAAFPAWITDGSPVTQESLDSLAPLIVPQWSWKFTPPGFEAREDEYFQMEILVTNEGILRLRHWSKLVEVNHMALTAFWTRIDPLYWAWASWRVLSGMVFGLTLDKYKLLRRLSHIGKGCDIHPTASIEASYIDDGAQIGPYAVVTGSYIGKKARIESHGTVIGSFLGDQSFISFKTHSMSSVLMQKAAISFPGFQVCVVGRETIQATGSYLTDIRLTPQGLKDVKVMHKGQLVESGKQFLGSAVGHNCVIGSGIWLNSGLSIPNRTTLVRDRADMVMKLPELDPEETYSLQEGEVLPFGQRYRERKAARNGDHAPRKAEQKS